MNTCLLKAVPEVSIPNYRVLDQVGHGQFGQVFCGIHRQTGQMVAIKQLNFRQLTTPQFLHELNLLASLQHPNIVAFHTLEYDRARRYLIMDYCEAGTLRQLMDRHGPLEQQEALRLTIDIVQALAYAHAQGVVHCDLKPENILLKLIPAGLTAHLADFGVARLLSATEPSFQQGDTGSPAYMAPERFFSNYGPTSDIYTVGVLLYELLVGKRPFSGLPGALMTAHINEAVEVPAAVPLPIRSIIQQAMQKLPQNRFASAQEMLVSLRLAMEVAIALTAPQESPRLSTPKLVYTETLVAPISALAMKQQWLYLASRGQIVCRPLDVMGKIEAPVQTNPTLAAGKVAQIWPSEGGVFVKTQPADGPMLSWQAIGKYTKGESKSWQSASLTMAIAPGNNWMVVAGQSHRVDTSQLRVEHESRPYLCQILQLPSRQSMGCVEGDGTVTQVLALNQRHGLALVERDRKTTFRLFNRRGDCIDYYQLPLPVEKVTASQTHPYRLLGLSSTETTMALLIHLKPLEIRQIQLPLSPAFMGAAAWGYWGADQTGHGVLIDESGEIFAQFGMPLDDGESVSAIASHDPSFLIVATWSGQQGKLYTVDLHPWLQQE